MAGVEDVDLKMGILATKTISSRRDFLRSTGSFGAWVASSTMLGCLRRGARSATHPAGLVASLDTPACALRPVHVSEEREIRTVVGLRPYRPSGFVVRAEKLGDTLVIHNFGHGGGGITLSWGTSKLAVDLGAPGHSGAVAVIGSGAVGLATARLLQEAGFAVTIYTKALPPETTSNIAGGQWFPFLVSDSAKRTAAFNQQFLAAAEFAYKRYQIMLGPKFGVRWMKNYDLRNEVFNETGYRGMQSVLRSMMPELRDLGPDEHAFPKYKVVRQYDSMLIEPPIYLAAMLDEFLIAGGKMVVREFADRAAIAVLNEKLVFNCTGLGAKALFQDEELTPVKGQLTFLLPQPEVQYAVLHEDLYMFPRSDGILLGGTHETGVWSLDPDLAKKREILSGHAAFFNGFRKCAPALGVRLDEHGQ
jgi:glycine/D-amino acid oxidase-like deaminating enzyme